MTKFDEDVLDRTMGRLKAWDLLENPEYCGRLNMVGLYNLLLKAGVPSGEAQEVANKRGWDRLSAGEEM